LLIQSFPFELQVLQLQFLLKDFVTGTKIMKTIFFSKYIKTKTNYGKKVDLNENSNTKYENKKQKQSMEKKKV
jgi:hypothetical protein